MLIKRTIGLFVASALLFTGVAVAEPLNISSATAATATVEKEAITQILNETNIARKKQGLKPLTLDPNISKVARAWSVQMASNKNMAHNPSYSKQMPTGWRSIGENVAAGYNYKTVTAAWLNSPGHKANIMGDFTHIGIGYYVDAKGYAWSTQNFGKYSTTPSLIAPPKNLKSSAGTQNGFTLSWSAPATKEKIAYYTVTAKHPNGSVHFSGRTTTPSIKITKIQGNVKYNISVVAVTASNKKSSPGSINITLKTTTPVKIVKPAVPKITAIGTSAANSSHKVVVKWNPATQGGKVTNWAISYLNPKTNKTVKVTLPASAKSHTITGLPAGKTVTVSVAGKNSAGVGPVAKKSVKTKNAPAATKAPAVKNISSTKLQVSWSKPSSALPVTYYKVIVTNSAGKALKTVTTKARTSTIKLTKNSTYRVKVQAVSHAGGGSYSSLSKQVKIVR